ncbi:MAG: hypothetical protein NTZ56_20620 [Acidobacteria bacterium]|nr:hypothetical protein [Acidobacteriota bacterium]
MTGAASAKLIADAPRRIFISFSSNESADEELADALRHGGGDKFSFSVNEAAEESLAVAQPKAPGDKFSFFLAKLDIPLSVNWRNWLLREINEDCQEIVVLLSPAALRSTEVWREVAAARRRWATDEKFRIHTFFIGKPEKFSPFALPWWHLLSGHLSFLRQRQVKPLHKRSQATVAAIRAVLEAPVAEDKRSHPIWDGWLRPYAPHLVVLLLSVATATTILLPSARAAFAQTATYVTAGCPLAEWTEFSPMLSYGAGQHSADGLFTTLRQARFQAQEGNVAQADQMLAALLAGPGRGIPGLRMTLGGIYADQARYADAEKVLRAEVQLCDCLLWHEDSFLSRHILMEGAVATNTNAVRRHLQRVRAYAYYNLACSLAQSDPTAALGMLQQAVNGGFSDGAQMLRDPHLAPLRGNAGFEKLLTELRQ